MKNKKIKPGVLSILVFFIIGVLGYNSSAQIPPEKEREKAMNLVLTNVLKVSDVNEITDKRVYMTAKAYNKAEATIKSWREEVPIPDQGEWFLSFIDDDPKANWEHPVRYVLVNSKTNETKVIEASSPPGMLERTTNARIELKEHTIGFEERELEKFNKIKKIQAEIRVAPVEMNVVKCTKRQYAVLINGGYNQSNNHIRYWGDLAYIYTALIQDYGYTDRNIYVLNSDGASTAIDRSDGTSSPLDLDNDGDNDIDYSATKANVTLVFNLLKAKLTSNDLLFVFVTNHGGLESYKKACIWLWNGQKILDSELKALVDPINCQKMTFVLETCYSGGFVDDLSSISNVMVATACAWDDTSVAGTTYPYYNQFVYYWTAAVRGFYTSGSTPWSKDGVANADADSDGLVTMKEAFDFAYANKNPSDIPQYSENPADVGKTTTLVASPCIPTCSTIQPNSIVSTPGQIMTNLILLFSTVLLFLLFLIIQKVKRLHSNK